MAEDRANRLALPKGTVILLDYACSMSQLQGQTTRPPPSRMLPPPVPHGAAWVLSTVPLHATPLLCTRNHVLARISTGTSTLSPCMAVLWPHGEGDQPDLGPTQAITGRRGPCYKAICVLSFRVGVVIAKKSAKRSDSYTITGGGQDHFHQDVPRRLQRGLGPLRSL